MARGPSPPTELIRRPDGVEQLLVQAAELKVTAGPDKGRRASLRRGTLLVGSGPECDLVLADPAVSHRQLELVASADGFLLRDLGSTNGTFVGPLRVREALLVERTQLSVGRTQMTFTPRPDREPLELSTQHRFGSLFGQSPLMRHCFALLEQAARSESTVLLEGESGTGKELAAESLHEASPRAGGPFVVVDCGAIAPNLVESELFGHEKGAFTGADAARPGALERADRGTLFLDEIGELEAGLQPKLLRFLERREVRRVGGGAARAVDARVVAATNRNLEELVRGGGFREDLFYRLAVLRVELPPLRRRPEDIPLIALELARRLRPSVDPSAWLDERALGVLARHDWPGNARELRNVLERLAALPGFDPEELLQGRPRTAGAPETEALVDLPFHEAKERVIEAFERRYVTALLEREQGVVVRAAARAGVPRQTFFRLIGKHGLRGDE